MQIYWQDIWREFESRTGYTRKEISKFIGVNQNSVGNWYKDSSIPTQSNRKKINIMYLNLVCKVGQDKDGNLIIKSPFGDYKVEDGDVNKCISDLADMLLVLKKAA